MTEGEYKLTQYSRGAGCGCKIAPSVLQDIIGKSQTSFPGLIVGNAHADDAAVYDTGNGQYLIATTDFFMPIVDDAYDFGRIAAANAISDVYAMGGIPALALAVLGWPINDIPASVAAQVLEGARAICNEAKIPLAGGHTIDSAEPFFGLSVNGFCKAEHLKKNNTANAGDVLILTKPIGTGILATAMKRGLLQAEHYNALLENLTQLNSIGAQLGAITGVTAMTDVTGFGIAGHLIEMVEGAGLSAELYYNRLPMLPGVKQYLAERIVPDATYRNWNSYGNKIDFGNDVDVMEAFSTLPDPQTNGGLLVAVKPDDVAAVYQIMEQYGMYLNAKIVGKILPRKDKIIYVVGVSDN